MITLKPRKPGVMLSAAARAAVAAVWASVTAAWMVAAMSEARMRPVRRPKSAVSTPPAATAAALSAVAPPLAAPAVAVKRASSALTDDSTSSPSVTPLVATTMPWMGGGSGSLMAAMRASRTASKSSPAPTVTVTVPPALLATWSGPVVARVAVLSAVPPATLFAVGEVTVNGVPAAFAVMTMAPSSWPALARTAAPTVELALTAATRAERTAARLASLPSTVVEMVVPLMVMP